MNHRHVFPAAILIILLSLASWLAPPFSWSVTSEIRQSKGQTVYVPVYSNVFTGPRKRPFPLTSTLSIRNTDLSASFQITSIDFYNAHGKLVRRYLAKPLDLAPLASTYIHVEEKELSAGFGASFIVRWSAGKDINTPIVECVTIGATSGQGISFVSPGQEIRE